MTFSRERKITNIYVHVHVLQMSRPGTSHAHLCALPDDILRAMASFMPPSRVVVMAQCSHRFALVLRGELTRRLDGLFVVQPIENWLRTGTNDALIMDHFTSMSPDFCMYLFGQIGLSDMNGPPGLNRIGDYHLTEARKGYDGPPGRLRLSMSVFGNYVVMGPNHSVLRRFSSWLKRMRKEFLVAKIEGHISS
jgi:hypothetical protein